MSFTYSDGRNVEVSIYPSDGADSGLVVFIDTNFEPSDSKKGLRVLVNDDDTYIGTPYISNEE